jgi:hypothetical protein
VYTLFKACTGLFCRGTQGLLSTILKKTVHIQASGRENKSVTGSKALAFSQDKKV